ncbi:NAD-dependent epimerase/dehydratase family protein [Micromonospora sp. RTGN7]|uniref:NAD-dependent epimerase/dehydratase family protein n=1 Tax=Micromonospora sp. RTGN7 TaxID=3016526 RepID=UPI0029FEE3A7|nr:SDR family NAD(P)-dependent oxidoreductase [Micromonospora sp. RTGN7]
MSAQHWADKTVVVTGGTGFIGSHFVEELLARQAYVICLYRSDDRRMLSPLPATDRLWSIRVDLCDETALRRVFEWAPRGVAALIHCAAMWGSAGFRYEQPETVFEANHRPVVNVLKCAQRYGTSEVVLLGSGEVYRSPASHPLREEDDFRAATLHPTDGYYLAKVHEEALVETYRYEYGMNVFRPRLTGIYGPRDNFKPGADRVIPTMLARAAGDQEIVVWGDGSQTRTYMFVTDLVHAVLQMVEKNKHQTVNVGTSETVTLRQLAHLVCAALGKPDRIAFDTEKPIGRSSRTLDLTRLHGIIDFPPRGLQDGLEQTVDWCRRSRIFA